MKEWKIKCLCEKCAIEQVCPGPCRDVISMVIDNGVFNTARDYLAWVTEDCDQQELRAIFNNVLDVIGVEHG